MSRRALVTGITGFIGGVLARRLIADGWMVDALVRPGSDTASLSFADTITFHIVEDGQDLTPVLRRAAPDVVFHLASLYLAEHRPEQVEGLVRSNILFPALLAEAMHGAGVRHLINTGTAWQQFHGEPYLPVNLYAATKQAAEDLLAYYADARDLSVVTLRLFDTYGRGDKRRKLIQILIDAARTGENLAMSPGDQIVDLTHVDDVVNGFVIAAERMLAAPAPLPESYLLSGERHSVKSLAGLVAEALGRPLQPEFAGRPYRAREVMEPVAVTEETLLPGWKRQNTLFDYVAGHADVP
ncbi:NAD-dependent epimerase/dehydratase family protein [Stakelama sp. CBK3Z-3]|uniref:NAD-dependent epimerase/dehydratase family protein n=1 Tax=Stakelama flava TaxID=2860338 RepID=A0ABS6XJ92_9SPHN|nr:NAD-dependent epimerase/dehydratase family protein [Stakelama flava]MBW4330265.1 NAD-dependent epimerase/dehydratase family protein [Stakelama flava]